MPTYKIPGVYVEEIQSLPATVVQVATAIPAFIGYTEKADLETSGDNLLDNVPTRITSMAEYRAHFGGPAEAVVLTVNGTDNDATVSSVVTTTYKLYYAMQMFFDNGGGPCYVASCGLYTDTFNKTAMIGTGGTGGALAEVAKEDEVTMLVCPDSNSLVIADHYDVMKTMLKQCGDLKDRFTVIDVFASSNPSTDLRGASGVGTQFLNYGAAYWPQLKTTLVYPDGAVKFANSAPTPSDLRDENLADMVADANDPASDGTTAAALNPVLGVIREHLSTLQITMPPSGAVAGVYARVDASRGVWKAPANVSLVDVQEPSVLLTDDDQGLLNVDASGKSINAIRRFKGKGTLVYGARTLDGNSQEWKYIPVRRLFIMIEESIQKASEAMVFEPNDSGTWTLIKSMTENFLTGLWRDGALAGAKPEDAFYVNVGLGTTMTPQDILNGYLIIEVGIAAVRPAEFIILKFSHKLQES